MPRKFVTKPARGPTTSAYTLQEHEHAIRFSLLELYASVEHHKLKQAIERVVTSCMLEVVGWVRGDPVANVINASEQRTTPPAPKKRKNDGSLALSELTEEQRQRLKEHEERQKQLEV